MKPDLSRVRMRSDLDCTAEKHCTASSKSAAREDGGDFKGCCQPFHFGHQGIFGICLSHDVGGIDYRKGRQYAFSLSREADADDARGILEERFTFVQIVYEDIRV